LSIEFTTIYGAFLRRGIAANPAFTERAFCSGCSFLVGPFEADEADETDGNLGPIILIVNPP